MSASVLAAQNARVAGVVVRGADSTAKPLPGQWVVLHHVGQSGSGPLDSIRAGARGEYAFRFTMAADSSVYFASATYAGVAYFTAPFPGRDVGGIDARISVFDTTSTGPPARARSRHMIVFAADERNLRRIAEIYWIENAAPATRVAANDTPTWVTPLPTGAADLRVDDGDVAGGAVRLSKGNVEVFSPLSPGLRQLQIAYDMPARSFPLSVPVGDSLTVLEILVEDPNAVIDGAKLVRQPGIEAQGHLFQRFLAQAVPQSSTFRIGSRGTTAQTRNLYFTAIVGLVGVALLVSLARTMFAGGGLTIRRRAEPDRATALAHEIAALDERFERRARASDEERAAYTTRRDELKAQLTAVLAERDDRL